MRCAVPEVVVSTGFMERWHAPAPALHTRQGAKSRPRTWCPNCWGELGSPEAVAARLDLDIWTPGPGLADWWVDVTHHHAWTVRYRAGRLFAGRVARDAEKMKVDRYGPGAGGVVVTPAAVESWG